MIVAATPATPIALSIITYECPQRRACFIWEGQSRYEASEALGSEA
jgi:hypothetical protein